MSLAELARGEGVVTARMARTFDHPPATVWTLLTDAARLPDWLAPGRIEPRIGGAVRLDFVDSGTVIESEVLACQAGRLIEYSWSRPGELARPVRFELAAAGESARLTLTVVIPGAEDPARACAGWEAHLEMLAAALAGAPIKFPFETFRVAREGYKAKVAAL